MATELKLPDLGEGMDDADVLRVLVREGQTLALDDPIIEIESEKATLEVPADAAGTVARLLVRAGDTISVGQAILELADAAETADGDAAGTPPAAPTEAPEETTVPSVAHTARDSAPVAEAIADPDATRARSTPPPLAPAAVPLPPAAPDGAGPVFAAPSVRQLAREIGVDIRQTPGSGPGGRISIDDVKAHARSRPAPTAGPAAAAPLPDFGAYGEVTRERMSRVRRATAANVTQSWTSIPHVTLFADADVTEVEELRQKEKARAQAAGGNLTLTAILLKVAAAALKANPAMNASADFTTNELVLKRYVHLGVAADTARGLLVPVVRDVDQKSIIELAVELTEVSAQAREGRLPPDRLQGASFTVSNLGGLGAGHFTPIINPPEIGILGVGRATERPAYVRGHLMPRLLLPLALSFDHRAVDGADGARFLSWMVDALAQPLMLAMES